MNRRDAVIAALNHQETHALPFDVPVENILALLEVFQNQDKFFC